LSGKSGKHKIRSVFVQGLERLGGIASFVAYYQIRLTVDQVGKTRARNRMAIYNEYMRPIPRILR
jgi:hypothetical protein